MQHRAALWIIEAFYTSPLERIEAIIGLVPITLHLQKLNGHYYFHYISIPPSHTINSLLDLQYRKDQPSHRFLMSNFIPKQQTKLTSPIKDINECLSEITKTFCPLYILLSSGLRVVDHFSSRIAFYFSPFPSNKDLFKHIQSLNNIFYQSQNLFHCTTVTTDKDVKRSNVVTAAAHI